MTRDGEREAEMSPEARRLLRAGGVRVPEATQREVRRAVEARLSPRAGRAMAPWRLVFAAAVLLLATAAAAQGRVGLARLWRQITGGGSAAGEGAPGSAVRPTRATRVVASADESAPPAPPASAGLPGRTPGSFGKRAGASAEAAPQGQVVAAAEPSSPVHPPLQAPGLDWPGLMHAPGASETARAATATPSPSPTPAATGIVIVRTGRRNVMMRVAGDRVSGDVRGTSVALTIGASEITGKIGGDAVSIHIFGNRRAGGHVGGREVGFELSEIEHGWLVDASLPGYGARVVLDAGRLSFLPGCENELLPTPTTPWIYAGNCTDDAKVRIELSPAFFGLAPPARMIVLGLLLPEPDPMLVVPQRLFPAP